MPIPILRSAPTQCAIDVWAENKSPFISFSSNFPIILAVWWISTNKRILTRGSAVSLSASRASRGTPCQHKLSATTSPLTSYQSSKEHSICVSALLLPASRELLNSEENWNLATALGKPLEVVTDRDRPILSFQSFSDYMKYLAENTWETFLIENRACRRSWRSNLSSKWPAIGKTRFHSPVFWHK